MIVLIELVFWVLYKIPASMMKSSGADKARGPAKRRKYISATRIHAIPYISGSLKHNEDLILLQTLHLYNNRGAKIDLQTLLGRHISKLRLRRNLAECHEWFRGFTFSVSSSPGHNVRV